MCRSTTVLVLACLLTSCRYGMTEGKFMPAHSPKGVTAYVRTAQNAFAGELIVLRDDGVVILTDSALGPSLGNGKLRLVPYGAIVSSRFEQMKARVAIKDGRAPTADQRDRLRLVSRFPQGLTADLLEQLLRAYGQTDLAGVNP